MMLTKWQMEALAEALPLLDIKVILSCENSHTKKKPFTHLLYYLLNIFTLKNSLTKKQKYSATNEQVISFQSIYDGAWQKIPIEVTNALEDENISVVIKFGMGLLRIEDALAQFSIFSFHHGNPAKYRGRPAGFYEVLHKEATVGVIVQKLSNKLDAGDVFAFGESKVIGHSYKKTALNFYSISKYLLKKAIVNEAEGRKLTIETSGKVYKLPSNVLVFKFVILLLCNTFKRLAYGAFFEKKWQVALSSQPNKSLNFDKANILRVTDFDNIPILSKYSFYADPFFSCDFKKIRLEALSRNTGLGDIVEIPVANTHQQTVLLTGKHYSYPCSFMYEKLEYLCPEVASHSAQYIYALEAADKEKIFIKGLEQKRVVDATLLPYQDGWYLFFGENHDSHSVLHLWFSPSLGETFKPHVSSPVCISPASSRMGGRILQLENKIYRFGQNNERGYGESLTISEIIHLSETKYEESPCGFVSIDGAKGPHTIDTNGELLLLDYYTDEFSIFAGIRRLKAKLSKH